MTYIEELEDGTANRRWDTRVHQASECRGMSDEERMDVIDQFAANPESGILLRRPTEGAHCKT
ncbi:MAG: hypothetical protein OXC63_05420 [Aestuariivita sp.]|nr:hypothetical protein [Aestuariivita sp.]